MTDRIHSITLVLENDLRIDDAEQLLNACRLLRNVVTVLPNVSDVASQCAYARASMELRISWWNALDALDKSKKP